MWINCWYFLLQRWQRMGMLNSCSNDDRQQYICLYYHSFLLVLVSTLYRIVQLSIQVKYGYGSSKKKKVQMWRPPPWVASCGRVRLHPPAKYSEIINHQKYRVKTVLATRSFGHLRVLSRSPPPPLPSLRPNPEEPDPAMASEIEVLEDTTAAAVVTATATGVAAAGEADAPEESLKDDVYTGAAYGDLEKLHRLVEREGRSVTEPDGLGYHALQWAALNNRVAAAQYILEVRHSPSFPMRNF